MFRENLQSGIVIAVGATSSSIDPHRGEPVMTLFASGVQTYECEFDAQHRPGWVFRSPQATLFDASGRAVLRHGVWPSWQAEDRCHSGSRPVKGLDVERLEKRVLVHGSGQRLDEPRMESRRIGAEGGALRRCRREVRRP